MAVLEHAHLLSALAQWLDVTVGRMDLIVIVIGLASAVVDNVPLVALLGYFAGAVTYLVQQNW